MVTISETTLLFLKNILLYLALILITSCSHEEQSDLHFYYPKKSLEDHSVPVIAQNYNGNPLEQELNFNFKNQEYQQSFRFRIAYFNAELDNKQTIDLAELKVIELDSIHDSFVLEENTFYSLDHPLYIDSSASLIFEKGSQLYIDDAIDIINYGSVKVNGRLDNPVLITSLNNNWGGISSYGGTMDLKNLIITNAGGNDSIKVRHSYSQPAIYMIDNGQFTASNLYIINCLGKAMYLFNSEVKINKSLFADCDTGPEINWSKVEVDSIICMNIPDAFDGEDDDNDALYIYGRHANYPNSPPRFNHLLLGFAKDDGFDHGKNDMEVNNLLVYKVKDLGISLEGGHMKLKNIWLSDARVLIGVKQDTHAVIDSLFINELDQRTDILEHMQQDPTMEVTHEFFIKNKVKEAEDFWFPIF